MSHILQLLRPKKAKAGRQVAGAKRSLTDTLRYAAFLASLAGTYVAVDEGVAAKWGNKRCAAY